MTAQVLTLVPSCTGHRTHARAAFPRQSREMCIRDRSQDIGKVNKAEIKEAMDGVLKKMQGFDFTKFQEVLGKRGFKVREARASTGKLSGYYVTARSGTEYRASEIGKCYTLAHIERTQSKLKCNSMNISHGNKLTPGSGSFQR